MSRQPRKNWKTRLVQADTQIPKGFESLVTPTYRGSTTLFPNARAVHDGWRQDETPYSYGLYGTPTTLELAARLTDLEHGFRTFLTPGGQAALSLVYLAFLNSGDHVLVPESIYGPNRGMADGLLVRFGVEIAYYPPEIGAGIASLLKPNTKLVWCESPGSVTLEVQDVPAIVEVAHRHGATVALDNTYSAGVYFDAFAHGVDVTMQALTKYVGGHSDLLLGSITVRDEADYERVGRTHQQLGMAVSPDDCSLALRGMPTLAVRLEVIERSALAVARWLAERPEIERVLHPALPSCPGHELWQRDFTGSTGVFSVVFKPGYSKEQVLAFVDGLRLFKVGYSWGGLTSLAVPYFELERSHTRYQDRLVRLHVGLEDVDDLTADLDHALRCAGEPSS